MKVSLYFLNQYLKDLKENNDNYQDIFKASLELTVLLAGKEESYELGDTEYDILKDKCLTFSEICKSMTIVGALLENDIEYDTRNEIVRSFLE